MFPWHDPFWRVRHRYSPFPLPFAPSPTDLRTWKIELDPPQFTLNVPTVSPGQIQVSLHRILLEAGIALTPATSPWDPRSWFPLYRYGGDFAGTAPDLRFYSGVCEKDPRLVAVASEEVATGVTCYLLREHLDVNHIADVYALIQRNELEYVGAHEELRPDYFCEDASGTTLLVESKGATGTRSAITGHIERGWSQVTNVRPVNLPLRNPCGRIVIGTHFCIEDSHARSETTTIVKDPEGPPSLDRNPESDVLHRVAYAKLLRFVGQDVLAERLLSRTILPPTEELFSLNLKKIKGMPILPLGVTPYGDVVGLYGPTAKALFGSTHTSLRSGIVSSLRDLSEKRKLFEGVGYFLSNGTMVIHEPNATIELF